MSEKLKKNCYYLSCLLLIILSLILFRLIKIYDICCAFLSLFLPIIFGYIFAWALNPIYKKMNKKLGDRISICLLILFFILIYALLIWYLFPLLFDNSQNIFTTLRTTIDKLAEYPYLEGLKEIPHIDLEVILASCSSLIGILGAFGLVHIFGFYLLWSYDRVNSLLKSWIPLKYRPLTLKYIRKLSKEMYLYVKGTLLDTLILFGISAILYSLIGLKYPILLAIFSSITNIIPFVGPYIGGIPAVLMGLTSSLNLGLLTLGVIIFAQTVESNFINPLIMSKCIKVNPLLIIIALTIMGKFFGLIGMVFAVPLIILLKLTLEFINKYHENEELSTTFDRI